MLNRWFAPRFAHSDVPEKEQRLCGFASPDEETHLPGSSSEASEGKIQNVSEDIGDIRKKTHDGIAHTTEGMIEVNEEPSFSVEEVPASAIIDAAEQRGSVDDVLNNVRGKLLEVSSEALHGKIHPNIWFNEGDDFTAAYIRAKLNQKFHHEYRLAGAKKLTLLPADTSFSKLKHLAEKHNIAYGSLPNAFQVGRNIYFNPSHSSFLPVNEKDEREREQKRIFRERAVSHELTHFMLNQRPKGMLLTIESLLKQDSARYQLLLKAASKAMKMQLEQQQGNVHKNEMMHEILAITLAGTRHAYTPGTPQAEIAESIRQARTRNKSLDTLLLALEKDIATHEEHIVARFHSAIEEQEEMQITNVQDDSVDVFHNTDEDQQRKEDEQRAKAELQSMLNEQQLHTSVLTEEEVEDTIGEKLAAIEKVRRSLPSAQEKIKDVQEDERKKSRQAVKLALEYLGEAGTRLNGEKARLRELAQEEVEARAGIDNNSALSEEERKAELKALRARILSKRQEIFNEIEIITAPVEKLMKYIEKLEEKMAGVQHDDSKEEKGLFGWMNTIVTAGGTVRWLTAYDIIKVFSIYKEAIVDSYKAQQNVRTYKAAKDGAFFLKYVPYGRSVQQILYKQARAANDEETSKFAEYIKSEGFTYDELLGDNDCVMKQNIHNANRSKAIVEYAADHGWLYKMNKENGHDVYGLDFEGEFGTHSFLELINRNESGKEKEQKRGAERVKYHPDIPPIIDDMYDELKKKNLFAIRGMLEVLQDKAKIGESNTWGLTTLFRHMREDKKILEIMDKGLIDSIGGIGIDKSAWSLTLFKMQRNQIMEWKDGTTTFENAKPEFVVAQAITKIEGMLPPISTFKDKKEYDRYVAKVLAGQTVRVRGKTISIFMNEFNRYRKFWQERATSTNPGKTDDDFFNPDNGGSDPLLLPPSAVASILSRKSQGPYEQDTKARNFLAMVIWRADDLQSVGQGAYENYVKEMKEKLRQGLQQTYIQDAACNQIVAEKTNTTGVAELGEISSINILDGLHERGLVDTAFYKLIVQKAKSELWTETQKNYRKQWDASAKEDLTTKLGSKVTAAITEVASNAREKRAIEEIQTKVNNLAETAKLDELKAAVKQAEKDIDSIVAKYREEQESDAEVVSKKEAVLQKLERTIQKLTASGSLTPDEIANASKSITRLASIRDELSVDQLTAKTQKIIDDLLSTAA